jgi:N6-L-threonylcarbamoyladenine synthase
VILAIETSCDDTCAAVVTRDGELLSNVVSSQGVHGRFGGVVPEWASRHHLELANAVVDDALAAAGASLDDVSLVAVTQGPGLVGALLVGVATAKGIAGARRLPLAAVDHLQGHVAANFLAPDEFAPPFVCLLASGGHTLLARVGDYAGCEAFDKGARLLGLGYPGGPALSKLALSGDREAFAFPTGARVAGLDFSFAGLKTALLYKVRELGEEETARRAADLAASYEHAIVEALIARVERALESEDEPRLAIGGGVAANRLLRERAAALGVPVHIPPPELCTDNAAMIASAARWVEPAAFPDYLALDAYATRRAA